MTNTTSKYYFAHADLHFPADNPHVKFSQWMFLPTGSLQQPLSSAVSCTPIPNCSSWRAPETPKTPARGNWLFPCGFQTLFFQVGLLVSLERGRERDSGGQPAGREGLGGRRKGRDVQDSSLPRHWKGEATKPWTTNEFSFSLL